MYHSAVSSLVLNTASLLSIQFMIGSNPLKRIEITHLVNILVFCKNIPDHRAFYFCTPADSCPKYCKFGNFREGLFLRNFSEAEFRENKSLANGESALSFLMLVNLAKTGNF